MKKWSFVVLVIAGLLPSSDAFAENLTGQWKLFVTSNGEEIDNSQGSVGLNISKAGVLYKVQFEAPELPALKNMNMVTFEYDMALGRGTKEQRGQFVIAKLKAKYPGKYTLSDDGKSLERLDGSVTFEYKKTGDMLCQRLIGCFNRGKANLIRPREEKAAGEKTAAAPGLDSDVPVKTKVSEANKAQTIIDKTFSISSMKDNMVELGLAAKNRIEFQITTEAMDLGRDGNGRNHAVRVVLLDEDGYAKWKTLKYKLSLFGRTEKNTDKISGPCPALLKRNFQGEETGSCDLDAGKYYVVFYDGYPGFSDASSPSEFSASLKATAPTVRSKRGH